jgi:DUF4097 and DUF4098 domain-containing protein YvlB
LGGQSLSISPPAFAENSWPPGLNVTYEITVPHATSLDVQVANGPLSVRHLAGPVDAQVTNGPVTIQDIAEPVTLGSVNGPLDLARCRSHLRVSAVNGPLRAHKIGGPIEVEATNGPISLRDIESDVAAKVLNGGVRYRGAVKGNFSLSARHGGIDLRLPAESRFELDAESERGFVRSDFSVDAERTGSGGAFRLVLRTDNGPIRLRSTR